MTKKRPKLSQTATPVRGLRRPAYVPGDPVRVRGTHPKSEWVDAVIRDGNDIAGYVVDYPSHGIPGLARHPLKYLRARP